MRHTGERRLVDGLTKTILAASCLFVSPCRSAPLDESPFLYRLTDIGSLGGKASRGEAINDSGWITGESETAAGETRAFLWKPEGGMRDLGTLGGDMSRAFDVNNNGMVVGESMRKDQTTRAFVWTEEDGMRELPTGTGVLYSAAYAVNQRDEIAGMLEDHAGVHAVVWRRNRMTVLRRYPGTGNIQPLDVNEEGDVVGQIETGTDEKLISHAFFFRRALDAQNLADFRFISPMSGSAAVAVNSHGDAVGSLMHNLSRVHAFLFSRAAGVEILDDRGAIYSSASDLNDRDVVVGSSISSYTSDETACVWKDGTWYDLNETVDAGESWSFTRALGVNESGQITGYGVSGDDNRGFLLTPTGMAHTNWPSVSVTVREMTEPGDADRILVIKANPINDRPVRRIIFYHDAVQLGSVEEPPYEWGWQGSKTRGHVFSAVMTDNKGRIIRSPNVTIAGEAGKIPGEPFNGDADSNANE